MALDVQTTKEISDNIIAQLEATLNQTIPLLPRAFNRVLSKVIGAVFILLYKYGGFIFLQMFVAFASFAETTINGTVVRPLVEWGRLIGIGDPVAATQAELIIDITVEDQTGSLLSGTQLTSTPTGVTYILIGGVLLDAPVVQATVRAVTDQTGGDGSGVIGNLDAGAELSFVNPLASVARIAIVDSQTITAADGESEEAYRQRVIDRFQKIPQGGAFADYELWGEEVAGIINVYPYTSVCPGQVDLYVEATPESSGNPDGIPTDAQLQQVLDSVFLDQAGLATRRPANALPNALPIERLGFSTQVLGLEVNNPSVVQQNITDGTDQYFREREPFIDGLTIPPRLDRITSSAVAGLVEDIVSAVGGIFSSVIVKVQEASLGTSVFTGNSHDVSGQEVTPTGVQWSADGTSFFIVGTTDQRVYQYSVTVPFFLSGTILLLGNFLLSGQDTSPQAIRFNSAGTRMFILGATNTRVFEYLLDDPFDITGVVTFTGNSFDVSPQEAAPTGLAFSLDGKKFFIVGAASAAFEYTLSVGFSLSSTVAFSGNSIDLSPQSTAIEGIEFSDRGAFMIILGDDLIFEYRVAVPYAFGTDVIHTGVTFNVSGQEPAPKGLAIVEGKFYITGDSSKVYDYNIGTVESIIDLLTLGEGQKAKSIGVTFL